MTAPAQMLLTDNARTVLQARYLFKDQAGKTVETPEEMMGRVARALAHHEKRSQKQWREKFLKLLESLRFVPNSPTLMNAGKKAGQLSACFVLPIEDSLEGIFNSLKYAALIHQSGGGTGFSFSKLRPKGSTVKSTHGIASGPVSFLKVFDRATETIKQGGTRRGANMGILSVDHPDLAEFIDVKQDLKSVINFNLSVAVTDAFMEDLEAGEAKAHAIFDRVVDGAWKCGDPGIIFIDRINRFNPTPKLGPMESTNPCGEQPLLPFESCNLGSLDLSKYWLEKQFKWDLFVEDVHLAVRLLDLVIDANEYPVQECREITLKNRKIGLGVMGLADLLLELGIPYESEEARTWAERIMSTLDREAKKASVELAREKGAFPNWKGSLWDRLGYPKMRNATVTTVAPTGTISMIAGCSSGIEPVFAAAFYRKVLDGKTLVEVNPVLERRLRSRGLWSGPNPHTDWEGVARREFGGAWKVANEISVEAHLKMQAVFQRYSDSAVSKTINLPHQATRADIAHAYREAYRLGCKGITVFRDGSRGEQVLNAGVPTSEFCEDC